MKLAICEYGAKVSTKRRKSVACSRILQCDRNLREDPEETRDHTPIILGKCPDVMTKKEADLHVYFNEIQ